MVRSVVLLRGAGSRSIIESNPESSLRDSDTIGVSIHDMWAEPTSTPRWATSSRRTLAKISAPAFDAWYELIPGAAVKAASEETTST